MLSQTCHPLLPISSIDPKAVTEKLMADAAQISIAQLTRRLARGDEEAFREFHAQYFDRLYRLHQVIARGQEHEAREALQETLLRVLRHTKPFDTEDKFWLWLKTVARNATRDAGRKRSRYFALLEKFATLFRHEPAVAPVDDDWQTILNDSLAALDETDRQLITGKYLEGSSVKELSAQTGLTEKAIESRLLRLRRSLREKMLNRMKSP